MTKNTIHKLSRNTEYYALDKYFDDIYHVSKRGGSLKNLYDTAFSPRNIALAFRNLKFNKGSKTPGVDDVHIGNLKSKPLNIFIRDIQKMAKNYKPSLVRRVWIPKPNGKKRPIGIPTLADRLFQQCIKQVIEPICEAKFHPHSYVFRPNRSTSDALARALFLMNQNELHYVVDIDIQSFFDTIDHGKLLKQCWAIGIRDKKILSIMSKMLKAEVVGEGISTKGTPQGGILSPLLSNICLNELDWWYTSQWATFPTKYPYKRTSHAARALRGNSKLKEFHSVRYADDFKIFCRDYKTAVKIFAATRLWLKDRLNLQISSEKSSITNLRKKSSPFLGISLRACHNKNGKFSCRSRVLDKAMETMKSTIKAAIIKLQKHPNPSTVLFYNSTILGYSSATDCTTDFHRLGYIMSFSINARLKKLISNKGSLTKTYRRKYKWKSSPKFICGIPLFPISEIRHRKLFQFSQKMTPYTQEGRQMMHKELDSLLKRDLEHLASQFEIDQSIEYNDSRISKWSLQKGRCAVTKNYLGINFHCHHITPRSKGGSDHFSNLVIVSPEVHRLIHATDSQTITVLLNELKLNKISLRKLNKFREQAGINTI
uniref:Putative reverse-transcriptase protein n=2 Tax=Volvox carteri TaxID=3067 RepID=D0VMY9_VOLCA|nr:putative intron-encoded reverse transcriptase [Volvox carteri]ACY06054.1 putative reverse-transcriptase protein [Volvox carteri f. nagariensis]